MIPRNKTFLFIISAAAVIMGGLFFVWGVSSADTSVTTLSADAKQSVQDKQDQLAELEAKIKAYQQIVNLKQKQGSTLADQIQQLEAQAASLQLQIDENTKQLDGLVTNLNDLTNRIADKEVTIDREKKMLAQLMQIYSSDFSQGSAALFLSSSDTLAYFNQSDWTEDVSVRVTDLVESIKALRQSLAQEYADLDHQKQYADTLHIQLAEQNDYLASTKQNKADLLAKTQADLAKYNNAVDDLQNQRDEIENEIQNLESGLVDSINLKDMPAFKHGLLDWPLKNHGVSQGYGQTSFARSSGMYKNGFHNGLDFPTPVGSTVFAPADGKVVATGNNGQYAYGRWMAIDHGNGLLTMYGHLSSITKSRGSSVKRGDAIALSGNTGNSTGPHLHFTVFSAKTFEVVPSSIVPSLKDIPIGGTVNPSVYLP